jgi:hypothetical protein
VRDHHHHIHYVSYGDISTECDVPFAGNVSKAHNIIYFKIETIFILIIYFKNGSNAFNDATNGDALSDESTNGVKTNSDNSRRFTENKETNVQEHHGRPLETATQRRQAQHSSRWRTVYKIRKNIK